MLILISFRWYLLQPLSAKLRCFASSTRNSFYFFEITPLTAYQIAHANCLSLMKNFELKYLFIQALREAHKVKFYTDARTDKKFLL